MATVKPKKHSTVIDMTAMSDVTVLLLTFFMLTATFLPKEPIQVITPASVIDIKIPEANLMTILIKPEGGAYVTLDRPADKRAVLDMVAQEYNVTFSDQQVISFLNQPIIGVPVQQLPAFLNKSMLDQDADLKTSSIPVDSLNNQLADWIRRATTANKELRIALKADRSTPYPLVEDVISTLQDMKQNRFHLMTTLRGMPDGF
jgi:biopolymer transport protein ExbD